MLCILHGYLLEGSGSNLWTREIVRALVCAGENVHLVCQENHPELYDFIAEARLYQPDGTVETTLKRQPDFPGRCVLHKPLLGDTLPVYVRDRYEEFANVVPMVELGDQAIAEYLARNLTVVERVVRENAVTAIHANHAVLMSVIAERVGRATGVPFAVMPHGSAIEYAVKKDPRFHGFAESALTGAGRIFAIGPEMRQRVCETFPKVDGVADKLITLNLGVDTAAFEPVARAGRAKRISGLKQALATLQRGREADRAARLREDLARGLIANELTAALDHARGYVEKRPDEDLEVKLSGIDWAGDEILLFVGRLIASKGLQAVVAALPEIIAKRPRARLVVVGHGPQREVIEALIWALQHGERELVQTIADQGGILEGGAGGLSALRIYLDQLATAGELDRYFERAAATIRPDRVVFSGYLTHRELKHLFPCADAAVFPSVVAEAGPLVFLEALASGVFPLGTDFAGMAASIAAASRHLPGEATSLMKLRPDPSHLAADIAAKAPEALANGREWQDNLRRAAVEGYDWSSVAAKLAAELKALAQG